MCSECRRGSYDADKIVKPCNGQHRYIWDSKRTYRFCESCFEQEEPLQELLARCFAVYQAKPVATEFPPILVGQKISDKGFEFPVRTRIEE